MERIYLTGFMGSGKSFTGARLAQRLGYAFVDLDAEIEEAAGKTISEIFAAEGEDHFRQLESDALSETFRRSGVVVATGGGAPCFHGGMARMNAYGTTVFLDPPMVVLLERLTAERAHRPLLAVTAELRKTVEEKLYLRRPVYERALVQLRLSDPHADAARTLARLLT